MKKPILLLALIFGLLSASAQNFEGTWKGTMMQDSPKVRIDFEMVLEQKEGRINGFLYRLFIVNDSLIYNTVRVSGRVSDNMLIVEDEESVSRNFEERANRKIKAAYFFKLDPKKPSVDTLKGEWTTSRFKNKYMSVSGKVTIRREIFYETTQLFKRLEEKQLHTTIAFVPKSKAPDIAMNKKGNIPEPQDTTSDSKTTEPATVTSTVAVKPSEKKDSVANTMAVSKPVTQEPTSKSNQQVPVSAPNTGNNDLANSKPAPATVVKKDTILTTAAVGNNPNTSPVLIKQPSNKTEVASTTPTKTGTAPVVKNNEATQKDSVQNTVVVTTERKNDPSTTVPPKKQAATTIVTTNKEQKNNPSITAPAKQQPASTATVTNNIQQKPVSSAKADSNNIAVKNNTQPIVTNKPVQQPTVGNNPVTTPPAEKPSAVLIRTDEASIKDSLLAKQKPITTLAPPVINNPILTKRATEVIQTLDVFGDSVTLSLYDNGEIDGDTVSVFLNNEKILSNVGLKASAYKHTIYFKPGETLQLTLFAENLGTIPPNSGLLVLYSGDQRYQIFFTSTLNKSAVILLRRE